MKQNKLKSRANQSPSFFFNLISKYYMCMGQLIWFKFLSDQLGISLMQYCIIHRSTLSLRVCFAHCQNKDESSDHYHICPPAAAITAFEGLLIENIWLYEPVPLYAKLEAHFSQVQRGFFP